MTDIVLRLKEAHQISAQRLAGSNILADAAAEIERLRAIVAVFEANEARHSQPVDARQYCFDECIAPKLRAAYEQKGRPE